MLHERSDTLRVTQAWGRTDYGKAGEGSRDHLGNYVPRYTTAVVVAGFILATGIYFYFVNRFVGYLLIPYFLWVSFASFLNYSLWRLNK